MSCASRRTSALHPRFGGGRSVGLPETPLKIAYEQVIKNPINRNLSYPTVKHFGAIVNWSYRETQCGKCSPSHLPNYKKKSIYVTPTTHSKTQFRRTERTDSGNHITISHATGKTPSCRYY